MRRGVELGRSRSWNITQRGRVREFGRNVAIVESPNGPHVVASLMRDGMWRVAEMDLRGRLLREWSMPNVWKVVGIVSPVFTDGTTDDRYAVVYRDDTGYVFHRWFRPSNGRAR